MSLQYWVFLPVFARRNSPECSVLAVPLADSSLWTSGAQERPRPPSHGSALASNSQPRGLGLSEGP